MISHQIGVGPTGLTTTNGECSQRAWKNSGGVTHAGANREWKKARDEWKVVIASIADDLRSPDRKKSTTFSKKLARSRSPTPSLYSVVYKFTHSYTGSGNNK